MEKRFQYIITATIVILSVIVLYIAQSTFKAKTNEIQNRIYLNTTENLHTEIDLLVKNKRQSTLSLALALSRDSFMINALKENDPSQLKLAELSLQLREFTRFKNVWFQIIDVKGYSFYRSWVDKRGDRIADARIDIRKFLEKPVVKSSISVGKFDMTFKSMVPIYDELGKFLGIFEIITHFNSISKKLKEQDYSTIILADKKYKNQLKFPFTKTFINDYYVANLDADENLMNIIKSQGVEKYIDDKSLYNIDLENNLYFTMFPLASIDNTMMGYIIVFKKLDTFIMEEVKSTQLTIIFSMIFSLLLMLIFGYYLFNKKYNSLLEKNLDITNAEKEKIKTILSAQPYIIILLSENNSYDVNEEFFNFFDEYKTLNDFKNDIGCICEKFVVPENDNGTYLHNSDNWIDLVVSSQESVHKVAMYKGDELHYFIVRASEPTLHSSEENFKIFTFIDVTEEKRKEELLFEQSKHASMGEMIANIAHQWRQPLSVISTAATGMLMQKEIGVLNDAQFENSCNQINDNSQYLSKTIDDFRDFLKGESKIEPFNIKDGIDSFVHLIESVAKDNNIFLITSIEDGLIINGSQSELLQCFINIFNNSKDALKTQKNLDKKYFFIDIYNNGDGNIIIELKDNAGGIDNKILNKVFEPYFTTKHKSQGTGLGLSMTYKLITSQMGGSIRVQNDNYNYNGINYKGAIFIIILKNSQSKQ